MSIDTGVVDLEALRAAVGDAVLAPDDEAYEERRLVELGNHDERPAAVVVARDVADVVATVRFAAEHGVELAVRAGGHSAAGHGTTDGGVVLDLRTLDAVEVDVAARTATVGGGATVGRYTDAAAAHGLATPFGDTGSVGVAGLTLGGGVGFLSRRLGLTVDSLLAAQVVTADGVVREVDAEHEPDLFWALRGGGGNLGVVTRLTFRLHEVADVVGGMLVLPATPAVLRGALDLATDAPRDLTAILTVAPAPPFPFLPAEVHGRLVIMVGLAHVGPTDEGLAALDAFRSLAEPLADLAGPMPYAQLFAGEGDGPPFRPVAVTGTVLADTIGDDALAQALDWVTTTPGMMRVVQIRPLGGAVADVAPDATAYAHRNAGYAVYVAAMDRSLEAVQPLRPGIDALTAALAGGRRGVYVNFLGTSDPADVHDAYPDGTRQRLAEVKRRYDPGNVFHRNHNVPPA